MGQTIRNWFEEALTLKNKKEAEEWFEIQIARNMQEHSQSREEATRILASNLGYMTGYYGPEEAQKIYDLFGIRHPIFGGTLIPKKKLK